MLRRLAKHAADLLLRALAALGRFLRAIGLSGRDVSSTLVLPPAATGNLGDDAMVSATLDYVRGAGAKRIGVIAFGNRAEWREWLAETEIVDLGRPRWLLTKLKFLLAVTRFGRFYCLGADMMDGYYFPDGPAHIAELSALASAAGARTAILGFSFNDRPTAGAMNLLRNLPAAVRLCVRDPISYERLAARLDRPIELVADVAFTLRPGADDAAAGACRWIAEEKRRSRVVVGVNLNHRLFLASESAALGDVVQRFRSAVIALFDARPDLSFVFIPHDYRPYRGNPGDVEVSESLVRALPDESRGHSMVVGKCRAAGVRAICGQLDFVVTGLMHLAIGALEQGTPVACLSYQGKFEGLMSHFGIDGLLMDPEEAIGDIVRFVGPLLDDRQSIRDRVVARLPTIRTLAGANFA